MHCIQSFYLKNVLKIEICELRVEELQHHDRFDCEIDVTVHKVLHQDVPVGRRLPLHLPLHRFVRRRTHQEDHGQTFLLLFLLLLFISIILNFGRDVIIIANVFGVIVVNEIVVIVQVLDPGVSDGVAVDEILDGGFNHEQDVQLVVVVDVVVVVVVAVDAFAVSI